MRCDIPSAVVVLPAKGRTATSSKGRSVNRAVTPSKTRTLRVQQLAVGLPFVKLSLAELGLRRGDHVEISVVRGALHVKKTKAPKKPKPKARKAPPTAHLTRDEALSAMVSEHHRPR